ncbi:MAG: hypothetical protein WAM70_00890 [Pyrinomonadaceae bacterium]
MKNTMLILAFAVLLVAINSGCRVSDSSASSASQPSTPTMEAPAIADCGAVAKDQQHGSQALLRYPIRIAVFQDKSGSANTTRTEQLTDKDFVSPIGLLRCTGGELALGIVDDVSNTSLVRLRIEPPPTPPVIPQVSNVFERAQQDAAFQQRLNDYNEAVNKWRAETDRRAGAFLAQIGKVLQQESNAKKTNVWSALSRADLFLNESDATWPRPTHRYAIFNSDGVDTAHSKPIAIKSGAQLIIVNGAGSTGVFQSLTPERFESVQAGFQFISAKEMAGKNP